MSSTVLSEILTGLYDKRVVPYLGPGVLFDSINKVTGAPIPAHLKKATSCCRASRALLSAPLAAAHC